jgi:endoglucanase
MKLLSSQRNIRRNAALQVRSSGFSRRRKVFGFAPEPAEAGTPNRFLWRSALLLVGLICSTGASGAEEIHLRANQLGYAAHDPKIAIAFSRGPLPAAFTLVAATGEPCFTNLIRPLTNAVWGQFTNHAELDFSAFTNAGRFQLRLGNATLLPFELGSDVYAPLPGQLLEFMQQQRCGFNPWLNTNCHQADARTVYGPRTNGSPLDARGGWHDAGDLLKYQLTSGNATAQMLLALQLSPANAPYRRALADEARWGLEWLLKLHPTPDELYHQVADDRDHAGWRLPQNETVDYGWGKGGARPVYFADGKPQGLQQYQSASTGVANLAGRYAAAMALAYQLWRDDPQHRDFAARCLQAGLEVFEMGRTNEGVQQGNSYKAPYRYEETTWADDMEWGAAELFRATREPRFLDAAKRYAKLAAAEGWMGLDDARHYQFYPFMNLGHFRLYDLVDAEFKAELAGYYRAGIERCFRAGQKNPYRVGVPFIWCSNNLLVALVTQGLLYERMTGDATHRAFTARQRDWLLGHNPWGTTMFTEIGSEFPTDVHLMTVQLLKRPVRGGLVDGPVYEHIFQSLRGVSITLPDPFAAFQGTAVYHDDVKDYSTNEPTMDGTASAILMFVLLQSL